MHWDLLRQSAACNLRRAKKQANFTCHHTGHIARGARMRAVASSAPSRLPLSSASAGPRPVRRRAPPGKGSSRVFTGLKGQSASVTLIVRVIGAVRCIDSCLSQCLPCMVRGRRARRIIRSLTAFVPFFLFAPFFYCSADVLHVRPRIPSRCFATRKGVSVKEVQDKFITHDYHGV